MDISPQRYVSVVSDSFKRNCIKNGLVEMHSANMYQYRMFQQAKLLAAAELGVHTCLYIYSNNANWHCIWSKNNEIIFSIYLFVFFCLWLVVFHLFKCIYHFRRTEI